MDLSVHCQSCKEASPIKPVARDRLILSKRLGREFQHRCHHCGGTATYDIDAVTASAERAKSWGLVIAVLVALAFTVALWNLGWVSTLSFVIVGGIYVAIQQGEDRKATAFNSYRLGDTLTRRDAMGGRGFGPSRKRR
ncbi:MAG: hypothetical protein Rubg2KO_00390 [Rubricoccaceae bacterium]